MTTFSERFYIEIKINQPPQWKFQRVVRTQHAERHGFIRLGRDRNTFMGDSLTIDRYLRNLAKHGRAQTAFNRKLDTAALVPQATVVVQFCEHGFWDGLHDFHSA